MALGRQKLLQLIHRAAAATEEAFDEARRRHWQRTGTHQPEQIAAYHGYADGNGVHLSGRVLANRPSGGPLDDDSWWDNLANTWRGWESDEVAAASVTLDFGGQEQTVVTDEEGYSSAVFPTPAPVSDGLLWLSATASTRSPQGPITARHQILVPPAAANFGIISDIDDTVLHTGITSLLLAAKLTFIENAKTRKPLDGVAELYRTLQSGMAGKPTNPIFYISSSPWNLYDLLVDFFMLNEIPAGPLLLRDLGLDRTKFIKEKGHGHKLEKALHLLDAYPELPFVLIGDSGQEDPAIYAEVARQRPGRILACYIRDVDPEVDSILDTAVHRAVDLARLQGVPMILAHDSLIISEQAAAIGLMPPTSLPPVPQDAVADKARPETGEQAVQDALESIVPE